MADNAKPSTDPNVATDEVAGVHVQRVKVQHGADGSATDASAAAPLPVADAAALAVLQVLDNAISGSEMQVDVVAALPAGNNNIGDVDVASLPALPAGSNNIGQVDPRGNVAHDAADSGNPVKVGARARTALPTAVAQDDRTDNVSDKFGRQLQTTAPLDQRVSGSIDLTDTTTTDVIAAPGASVALVITDIEVVNGDATVGTFVEIFDDATKKWKGYAGALGGGFSQSNPDGLFVCTANKAVRAKCVTTSSETAVNISGYKIPA